MTTLITGAKEQLGNELIKILGEGTSELGGLPLFYTQSKLFLLMWVQQNSPDLQSVLPILPWTIVLFGQLLVIASVTGKFLLIVLWKNT